jgi:hypothetical protein
MSSHHYYLINRQRQCYTNILVLDASNSTNISKVPNLLVIFYPIIVRVKRQLICIYLLVIYLLQLCKHHTKPNMDSAHTVEQERWHCTKP